MKRLALLAVAFPLLGGGIAEGNRAYRSGSPRAAAEAYARRLERGDSSAVVRYNLGTALLRMGRWDEARAHLEAAADARAPRPLAVRAHYNAGNADLDPVFRGRAPREQRADRLRRAIARYRRALLLDPADLDAKWNLEIAQKLLEEERRNQPQNQDRQQQGGGGGGGGDPQQPAPASAPQQPSPASQGQGLPRLSQGEAERILSGAAQQERAAQRDHLERNKGRPQADRDW